MASHSMLKLVDQGHDSRRGAARSRVLMVAKLDTSSSEIDVRIRDVSASGARVEGAGLPRAGTAVILNRGSFEGFGQIVWSRGDCAGIQFDEPFDEAELMARLTGVPPVAAPEPQQYRRPGFNRGADHPKLSTGRGWIDSPPDVRS